MRRLLFLFLLLLPAAADDPPGAPVLDLLDGMPKVLHEQPLFPWIDNGLKPLRAGEAAIRDKAMKPLTPKQVRARIAAADVVLVADVHPHDVIRRAYPRLVEEFAPADALREGRVALAFEAVPAPWEEALAKLRAKAGEEELLAFFRSGWPWPVREYALLLRRERLRAAPALACGGLKAPAVPPADTEDRARVPPPDLTMDYWELKYGGKGFERNASTAERVDRWLRGAKGRTAFVLYGAAHLLDGDYPGSGIRGELEKRGHEVVVVVPFLVAWEAALRRRFGDAGAREWYEVLPGVLRAPGVSDDDIRKEAAADAKAAPQKVEVR